MPGRLDALSLPRTAIPRRQGFRQCGERREAGQREDDIRARLGNLPHQGDERFRRGGDDLNRVNGNPLHLRDGLAQAVGATGAAVYQLMVQEAMARLVSGLLLRCRERVYVGISELGESGFEQRGELLKAFQKVIQNTNP